MALLEKYQSKEDDDMEYLFESDLKRSNLYDDTKFQI